MSRYEFQGITEQAKAGIQRLTDARHLRMQGRWQGAMYLAGYAVECRLKARLMEMYRVRTLERLEEVLIERFGRNEVKAASHSIEALMTYTGAVERLVRDKQAMTAYRICLRWRTQWRYAPSNGDEATCVDFMDAVRRFLVYLDSNL